MNNVHDEKQTLHFDFSQSATRATILEILQQKLTSYQITELDKELEKLVLERDHYHNLAEIEESVSSSKIDERTKADLLAVYQILAHAEATVHECSIEDTHFHEVGRAEAIRNAATICIAMTLLDPPHITSTPIQTGSGKVKCAHGLMDIPAPATKAILDQGVPVCTEKLEGELCTPTSAAIIKHYVKEYL